ncbi:MAG TPA: hypothetical protein DCY18_17360 [Thauera sp.]|nr:hypothetical protein [Thauera sp.]
MATKERQLKVDKNVMTAVQRILADPRFAKLARENPKKAVEESGIKIAPDVLAGLTNVSLANMAGVMTGETAAVKVQITITVT